MPTYREALRQAQQQLTQADAYEQHAQLLMLELANQNLSDLYLCYDEPMPQELYDTYCQGVKRLAKQEPLQYVLGYQWFYGNKMTVTPEVLIPRYETEELVANVLVDVDAYFEGKNPVLADIGTGSGAIAISLKREEPSLQVYATDISETALKVAQKNADDLNAEVTFYRGDLLQPLIDRGIQLDILVSNPPYIPQKQTLESSVKDYEPHVALFGGNDGLYFYRRIFEDAHKVIKEHSFLAFEIGYDEKDALLALAKEYFPQDRMTVLQDLNGKDRMLFIYHNV
ncbi:MAG: peptide chain release factor N(5)-glutamine methyltransferase [Erysipelotrichaceae bacterium]|nr:peptide chain release factor N(5)-glutamine methyltransferase [Erysipelotrichaceae bacterium]